MLSIAKERLKEDLDFIIDNLRQFKPVSIILYGGYGRDEGSWIWENSNGSCRPYNDYDILMIFDKKVSEKSFKTIRVNLADKLGISWVDLGQKTVTELENLHPLIFNYDLKYASKVIYGNVNIQNNIPEIRSNMIPLKDVVILFYTRIWTLLGSLDKDGINVSRNGDLSRFFRNQMAKAILAIVDILLIQKGQYDSSYKERVIRFNHFYNYKEELIKLANWAIKEKLNPTAPDMTSEEVRLLYDKVYYHYFNEMYSILSLYYKKYIGNATDIAMHLKWDYASLIKRFGWLILKGNFKMERQLLLNIAQIYISEAYNYGDINVYSLNNGIRAMKKVKKTIPINLSWDCARCKVAEMRLEI